MGGNNDSTLRIIIANTLIVFSLFSLISSIYQTPYINTMSEVIMRKRPHRGVWAEEKVK